MSRNSGNHISRRSDEKRGRYILSAAPAQLTEELQRKRRENHHCIFFIPRENFNKVRRVISLVFIPPRVPKVLSGFRSFRDCPLCALCPLLAPTGYEPRDGTKHGEIVFAFGRRHFVEKVRRSSLAERRRGGGDCVAPTHRPVCAYQCSDRTCFFEDRQLRVVFCVSFDLWTERSSLK